MFGKTFYLCRHSCRFNSTFQNGNYFKLLRYKLFCRNAPEWTLLVNLMNHSHRPHQKDVVITTFRIHLKWYLKKYFYLSILDLSQWWNYAYFYCFHCNTILWHRQIVLQPINREELLSVTSKKSDIKYLLFGKVKDSKIDCYNQWWWKILKRIISVNWFTMAKYYLYFTIILHVIISIDCAAFSTNTKWMITIFYLRQW